MRDLGADLRLAARRYVKTPLSSALALIVLAAALAVMNAFLILWDDLSLRPHPGFEQSAQLVTIGRTDGTRWEPMSRALLERIATETSAFDTAAGVMIATQFLDQGDSDPEALETEL